jgi:hypothetical protein
MQVKWSTLEALTRSFVPSIVRARHSPSGHIPGGRAISYFEAFVRSS